MYVHIHIAVVCTCIAMTMKEIPPQCKNDTHIAVERNSTAEYKKVESKKLSHLRTLCMSMYTLLLQVSCSCRSVLRNVPP